MDSEALILDFLQTQKTEKAFNLIVDIYQERLYWHIRRMVLNHDDANDVLQNTYVKIWRALPKFQSKSKVYTWAYRIATNESITFLNKRRVDSSFDEVSYKMQDDLTSDQYFDGNEIQSKLFKAISTLPDKQKAVFNLKYFDEMKYEEMSHVLDTSVGALKASYHHAVKKIKQHLKSN